MGDRIPLSPPRMVYLVHGAEALLRDEAVAQISEAVLDPELADFNLDRFDGPQVKAGNLLSVLQTLPMMAPRRLVIVRQAAALKADVLKALVEYLADPAPETTLVLEAEKVDMRKSPFPAIKKVGAVVVCKPLYQRELVPWIGKRAAAMGFQIDGRAAQFLAAYTGADLTALAADLVKAADYAGAERIDLDAVEETVGAGRVSSVFELTDALGERRVGAALKALGTLLTAGEAPLKIQAIIVRHYRLLWRAQEALQEGGPLARSLGVAPFLADKLATQARRYRPTEMAGLFRRFARVDLDLKGGALSPKRTLEDQVCALCGPRRT